MALVVCTGSDEALLQTRRLILERAGHTVVTVMDELALLAACKKHRFDAAVIGQSTGPVMKVRVAALVRQHCPDVKVLELYQPHLGRILKDADSWLATPTDAPKDLADRGSELANGNGAGAWLWRKKRKTDEDNGLWVAPRYNLKDLTQTACGKKLIRDL